MERAPATSSPVTTSRSSTCGSTACTTGMSATPETACADPATPRPPCTCPSTSYQKKLRRPTGAPTATFPRYGKANSRDLACQRGFHDEAREHDPLVRGLRVAWRHRSRAAGARADQGTSHLRTVILLDTNVLSETLRQAPNERVASWFSDQPVSTLFTSAITRAELLYGVAILPEGERRTRLREAVIRILDEGFLGRVLAFDGDVADAYADIASLRRVAGRPISQLDAMIVAIARSREATLATRNTKDFEGCDVDLIDPWSD